MGEAEQGDPARWPGEGSTCVYPTWDFFNSIWSSPCVFAPAGLGEDGGTYPEPKCLIGGMKWSTHITGLGYNMNSQQSLDQ